MTDEPIKPDPKKKPKRPVDANQRAKLIVDLATGQVDEPDPDKGKNQKAVERGRLGGLKGGRERAERLSPEDRSEIAKRAAEARWQKRK
jgi:hypothetical protein